MNALLALFVRALRDDLRSKSTYWMRGGFVALVLLFVQGSVSFTQWVGAPGLHVFSRVLWMNLFFVSLAGLSYFASAITEEKEEGTLGLLRMTDLNPLAILLGKSTGRLAGALLLLAVQLPFTILATSLGGVSLAQVLAAYAMLGAYLFFLANLALVFSVICRRTSLAAALTTISLALFLWLPGWIADARGFSLSMTALDYDTTSTGLEKFLFLWWRASPIVRANEVLRTGFHGAVISLQVWADLALGATCFLIAWALFGPFVDRAEDGGALASGSGVRPLRRGAFRAGRPWRQAIVWKDFHFMSGGHFAAAVRVAFCAGILAFIFLPWPWNRSSTSQVGSVTMFVMTAAWIADIAIGASRVFRVERRGKTLSSLAALPTSLASIARYKALGCLLATWPAALFFLGGLALVASDVLKTTAPTPPPVSSRADLSQMVEALMVFALPVAFVAFFVHLIAWLSLRVKFGALPLAIVISVVGMQMTAVAFMLLSPRGNVASVCMLTMMLVLTGVLHAGIGRRLETLAAED